MATQLQLRRGTTAENDVFTGAPGELTMDTDTNGVRIHDGTTVGGVLISLPAGADYVVEWQQPTDLNNYTWYRKYKSDWVEQGGKIDGVSGTNSITLPVEMFGGYENYTASANAIVSSSDARIVQVLDTSTATTLKVITNAAFDCYWQVSGMAA